MTDPAVTPFGITQGIEELHPIGVIEEDRVSGAYGLAYLESTAETCLPHRRRRQARSSQRKSVIRGP